MGGDRLPAGGRGVKRSLTFRETGENPESGAANDGVLGESTVAGVENAEMTTPANGEEAGAGSPVAASALTAGESLSGSGAPLTEAQAGLWFAQRLDPRNPVFNTAHVLEIEGPLDETAFAAAVDATMGEADTLAVRLIDGQDGVLQVLDETNRPRLRVIDVSAAPDPRGLAESEIDRDVTSPVDPTREPLAVNRLYRLDDGRHLWYQRVHHLAIDGFGTHLLIRRVREHYAARLERREPASAAFRPFADLLDAEAAYRASTRRDADRAFWVARFEDRPDPGAVRPGGANTADRYITESVVLPATVGPAIRRLAEATRISWPDVATILTIAYLHRFASTAEIVTGVATMNRLGTVAARIPSMVMNILPIRTTVDEDAPLADVVSSIGVELRTARKHGAYRSEQLRRDLGLLGDGRRLYGSIVNVLPYDEPTEFPGLRVTERAIATGPVDDLSIELRGGGAIAESEILLEVQANPDRYSPDEVAAHLERLAVFLANAAETTRMADVPTVTPSEHQRWVRGVNDTAHPVEDTTLTALLERTMKAYPESVALRFAGATMSYAELDRASAPRAAALASEGIGANDVVVVALDRSFELLVWLVAILRAGAAYLPLDPRSPPERLARILDSAKPVRVIADAALGEIFPADAPMLWVDTPGLDDADDSRDRAATVPSSNVVPDSTRDKPRPPAPRDAAYVIYTSGSTGEPKGVVVEHRAIVNRLLWMGAHYGIGADDVILQKTPVTFDVSVWELFLPMLVGATLVIAPPEAHKDPRRIASIIRDEGVTTLHFVPSMLEIFLDEPLAAECHPTRVFCSGEALSAPLRDRFHAVLDADLHNLYGPTEAAVDVTWWNASADDDSDPVPIGFPVWNTGMYVLDSRLRPRPPSVPGDLYIGGVQLARGYLARPDLTADRFIPDPFNPSPARLYRTGDVAEWRPDGAIVFHGRSDFQVKIRGFRIELGEIEAALTVQPAIARAAVIVRKHPATGEPRIIAYLVPTDADADAEAHVGVGAGDQGAGGPIDVAALRVTLSRQLPDYMIPAVFMVIRDLPLTTSGKLDRGALPDPTDGVATGSDGRAPDTASERALATIFRDVLGLPWIGADDDFFLAGGHSLLAARVAARVRDEWKVEIGLGAVFAHPSVARLARHIDSLTDREGTVAGNADNEGLGPVVRLRGQVREGTPVFCVHPAGGISWCYRGLADLLPARYDVFGLQATGLDLEAPLPDRLDEMASDYVRRIAEIADDGPHHLIGWSVGGIIAQAMAVELRAAGREVGLIAMLDAYPADCWRDAPEPDESAALDALLHIAGHGSEALDGEPLTRVNVKQALRRLGHPLGELSDQWISGVVRVVERNARLVRVHEHRRFDGPILHFRAALDHEGTTFHPGLWAPYVERIEVIDIASTHPRMIQGEPLREVAAVIEARLGGWQ